MLEFNCDTTFLMNQSSDNFIFIFTDHTIYWLFAVFVCFHYIISLLELWNNNVCIYDERNIEEASIKVKKNLHHCISSKIL